MAAVLAWPGPQNPGYAAVQYSRPDRYNPGKLRLLDGKAFRDVGPLCSYVSWLNSVNDFKDVWFCTSLQAKTKTNTKGAIRSSRSKMNALYQKAVWADLDVGADIKKYATQAEAYTAIIAFAKLVGLPRPSAMVNSGGGLHVYWISKTALTPDEWRPFAEGLKGILLANNIKFDASCTADIARILRMPGTLNYKTEPPKPVELLPLPLKLYDFETDLAVVKPFAGAAQVALGPGKPVHSLFAEGVDPASFKDGPHALFAGLLQSEPGLDAGIDKFSEQKVDPAPIFAKQVDGGCEFYREAFRTGGKDHSQPLWNYAILGTTFMENGNAIAHEISKGHADYSAVDTQEKYDIKVAERANNGGIGYPSCALFEANGSKSCAACPLKPKGKSPLNIRPVVTATVNPTASQSSAAVQVGLPAGFDFDDRGIICKVIEKRSKEPENEGEELAPEMVPLFQTKLTTFWAQKHPDCLNYTVDVDKGFIHYACVPHEEMSKPGFRAYLANPRCRTMIDTRGKAYLEEFYLSILGKLRANLASQHAVPFGWYEENGKIRGFAFGGRIEMDDGTSRPCGIGDPNIKRHYTPTGDLQTWRNACATVTGRKRPELTSIMLMSFASPLAKLIAKDSVLFSVYGDTAAGKSAAYKVGLSVWGHSKLTKGSETSTHNNVTTQMAEIKNLPFYWDEIEDDKHRETVAKVMHEASDGVQKGRNKDGQTTAARGEWKLMIFAASNQSFKEFLYNRNKNHSASIVRCLEWKVQKILGGPGHMKDAEASALIDKCESNYGKMGELYAAFLAQNHEAIAREVVEEANKVEAFYGNNGEERYWQAGVACMICAARYAKQLGVDVDPDVIKDFMYDVYRENREAMVKRGMRGGIVDRAETVLTLYLKARAANERVIWTNYMHRNAGAAPKPVVILKGPQQPRNQQGGIEARFAIENQELILGTSDFDAWMIEHKYQTTPIYDMLEKNYGAYSKQLTLASGTVHQAGREPCLVLTVLPKSSLDTIMMMYATDTERKVRETGEEPPPEETGFDNVVPLRA